MNLEKFDEKKGLIRELINSGINVTPLILDFLFTLDDPLKKTKLIIKNVSFLPNFRGHLTVDILNQISNEEITKVLERTLNKELGLKREQERSTEAYVDEKSLNTEHQMMREGKISKKQKIITHASQLTEPVTSPEEPVVKTTSNNELLRTISTEPNKKNPFEHSKSTLAFRPVAKDYSFSYEVLKDPTGKLYTEGGYKDFYDLTLDKFNKLRSLMKKRPEVVSASNINNLLRLRKKEEVCVIGLIKDIRKTKNGNLFLVLEDLTSIINVIIRKDSENQDNVKIGEKSLNDQMVYVEGLYNPGDRGKNGIIFCNYISKIDIPRDYEPHKSIDPLSIALISDLHIGSKEFEETLWKRFVDLLNGKVGNQNQRNLAGRIKYLIINGDLVDGIGIYPSQKEDLVLTDIYAQYKEASNILSNIPDYIKIFYSSGNHEPVRNAIPRPAVPKKYSEDLINKGVICVGNPSLIQTHNVNTLVYHGDSILDINMLIPGFENNKPTEAMKELLICRHLAPIYGKKTQIAPVNKDWLVIDTIPDIFHTGHIHINGMDYYNNIALVNSGCFQSQTDFMNSLGIHPTPGVLSIVDLDTLKGTQLDLKISI